LLSAKTKMCQPLYQKFGLTINLDPQRQQGWKVVRIWECSIAHISAQQTKKMLQTLKC
jgi:hypothetical protein